MTESLIIMSILLAMFLTSPFVIYLAVRLAAFGYLSGRQRFREHQLRKERYDDES